MIFPLMAAAAAAASTIGTAPTVPAKPAPEHRIVYSDHEQTKAAQDRLGWADSVTVGDTVYVSGVIAYTLPEDKGLEPAYTRAFDRLTVILARAGCSWADVVEVRSFHTDPRAQINAIATVKRRYRAAPDPAWTAVGTSALLAPNGITEIALVARKPVR